MAITAAVTDPWRWQPHVEVWVLVVAVIGLGLYAARVIGPKAALPAEPVVTRKQRAFFIAGVLALWLGSDWPMHDVSEEYLYAAHMVQHMVFTLVMPPLFLLATPTWLARLLVGGEGFFARWARRLSRPVPAALLFNGLLMLTHWPSLVGWSLESGAFHYSVHLVLVVAAFFMWMPICGPIPEWRISRPAQMLYLFIISIIPTVPSAWLILAENPVYKPYDQPTRLFGVDVITDQQVAGLTMKLMGGMYLWVIITVIFFRWAFHHQEEEPLPAGAHGSDRSQAGPGSEGEPAASLNGVDGNGARPRGVPEMAARS